MATQSDKNSWSLTHVAGDVKRLPNWERPEFAFSGASNVGKSSLLNALMRSRKNIARVSKTPGCTQTINVYEPNDKVAVIDLPGHGYASVSKQKRRKIQRLVEEFLGSRAQLHRLFFLADARIGFKGQDLDWLRFINDNEIPTTLVLSKCDSLPAKVLLKKIDEFKDIISDYAALSETPIATSAKNGTGIHELKQQIFLDKVLEQEHQERALSK